MNKRRRFHRTGRTDQRTPRQGDLEPIRDLFAGALATANDHDGKYFTRADVVTLTVGREDLDTIAAALVFVGKPETLSLLRRFRCI